MLGMSDAVASALIASLTTLILAGGGGLRWFIQRKDALAEKKSAEKQVEQTEAEALETAAVLRAENDELREDNRELRTALTRVLLELSEGGRRT